jgi:hypothetical protein
VTSYTGLKAGVNQEFRVAKLRLAVRRKFLAKFCILALTIGC